MFPINKCMKYHQGYFRPKYPEKYKGNPTNIIYRSGLEFRLMKFLDDNKNVIKWASEEFFIPYTSPIDGMKHRYFPDFWVRKKGPNGSIEEVLIEVKPSTQCKPPSVDKKLTPKGKISRRYINEVKNWGVNSAKWEAAKKFCTAKGWRFVIMTEKDLTLNG